MPCSGVTDWKESQPRDLVMLGIDCFIHLCFSRCTVGNFTISVVEFSVKCKKLRDCNSWGSTVHFMCRCLWWDFHKCLLLLALLSVIFRRKKTFCNSTTIPFYSPHLSISELLYLQEWRCYILAIIMSYTWKCKWMCV